MSLSPGQLVNLKGSNQVGRICKLLPQGFFCVRLEGRCVRVAGENLAPSNQTSGPLCDSRCNSGC
jgi:hypothetical protein